MPVKVCYKGAIIRDPLFLDLLVTDMSKKESDGSSIDVANSSSLGLWVFGFNFLFYLSPHTIEQQLLSNPYRYCYRILVFLVKTLWEFVFFYFKISIPLLFDISGLPARGF